MGVEALAGKDLAKELAGIQRQGLAAVVGDTYQPRAVEAGDKHLARAVEVCMVRKRRRWVLPVRQGEAGDKEMACRQKVAGNRFGADRMSSHPDPRSHQTFEDPSSPRKRGEGMAGTRRHHNGHRPRSLCPKLIPESVVIEKVGAAGNRREERKRRIKS